MENGSQKGIVEQSRSDDSEVCMEMRRVYGVSEEMVRRVAERYRLGKGRDGKTIYWMIDEKGICRDGHFAALENIPEAWVTHLIKERTRSDLETYRILQDWHTEHCLFGLHLLSHTDDADSTEIDSKPICLVETEREAVILSALYPENIWMAVCYTANINNSTLLPLLGHKVIIFPHGDDTYESYLFFKDIAQQARDSIGLDVYVSTLTEEKGKGLLEIAMENISGRCAQN